MLLLREGLVQRVVPPNHSPPLLLGLVLVLDKLLVVTAIQLAVNEVKEPVLLVEQDAHLVRLLTIRILLRIIIIEGVNPVQKLLINTVVRTGRRI